MDVPGVPGGSSIHGCHFASSGSIQEVSVILWKSRHVTICTYPHDSLGSSRFLVECVYESATHLTLTPFESNLGDGKKKS